MKLSKKSNITFSQVLDCFLTCGPSRISMIHVWCWYWISSYGRICDNPWFRSLRKCTHMQLQLQYLPYIDGDSELAHYYCSKFPLLPLRVSSSINLAIWTDMADLLTKWFRFWSDWDSYPYPSTLNNVKGFRLLAQCIPQLNYCTSSFRFNR